MRNSLQLLGTGGSMGIPVIGCSCNVCHSNYCKNHRLRPSALLNFAGKKILIDPGPDLRTQCLRADIRHLDGVILTHAHNDHCRGVDDLRVFTFDQNLPFLLSTFSQEVLKQLFGYLWERFDFVCLPDRAGKVNFQGIDIQYFTYTQGQVEVLGLRMGNLAYVTDIKLYDKVDLDQLKNLDILILSALRFAPASPAHLSIEDALVLIKKIQPKQTYLIHLAHEVDHDKVNQTLPEGVELGYDGLEILL